MPATPRRHALRPLKTKARRFDSSQRVLLERHLGRDLFRRLTPKLEHAATDPEGLFDHHHHRGEAARLRAKEQVKHARRLTDAIRALQAEENAARQHVRQAVALGLIPVPMGTTLGDIAAPLPASFRRLVPALRDALADGRKWHANASAIARGKTGQRTGARRLLAGYVATLLNRHGVRLSGGRNGAFGGVVSLVYELAGFDVPKDIRRDLGHAIAKLSAQVPEKT